MPPRRSSEYLRILSSIVEPEPPPPDKQLPFELLPFPVRMFLLPRPASLTGWIASSFFYFVPIRLTPIPTTCRMHPIARIEFCKGW